MSLLERLALHQNQLTSRVRRMPVLVLSPHSRCNCRCMMCDIWRANANGVELSQSDIAPHVQAFRKLRVRVLVLSGGEALMHRNLWALCEELRPIGAKIILLSTGLLLGKHAPDVIRYCDEVIVSLDGSQAVHDKIRNIPNAYSKLAGGVGAVLNLQSKFLITARCVLQRENFRDLPNILRSAEELGLKKLSFLAADVTSEAFNRPGGWSDERTTSVALNSAESDEFAQLVENHRKQLTVAHESGFVVESFNKISSIAQYYQALNGQRPFPQVRCNAPWVSAVIEPDGAIRPCFFHPAYGNIADNSFDATLNSKLAIEFRRKLDVRTNSICQRCVCSLNL